MKVFFRSLVIGLLLLRARAVRKRVNTVIGVTGSVGKTSTRMAIAHLLSEDYAVQTSAANFNTPIGLILSLLDIPKTGSSPFGWVLLVLSAFVKKLPSPDILVIEYGIDAPGDMDELLEIILPDILVVTPISLVHTAKGQFGSIEDNRAEECKLIERVSHVILNGFDSETTDYCIRHKSPDQSLQIFDAKMRGDVTIVYTGTGEKGITFLLDGDSFSTPVFGAFHVQVFAPAIMLAKKFGVSIDRIRKQLAGFEPPPGRGRIFEGVNGSLLWDFSYNSSPLAAREALLTLADITWAKRRIALLGTMNELGDLALQEHETLGKIAAKSADELVFVGTHAEDFVRGVAGQKPVHVFADARQAGGFLSKTVQERDFVLVKGSQNGVFLELAVAMLLADPGDEARLCRRSTYWDKVRAEKP